MLKSECLKFRAQQFCKFCKKTAVLLNAHLKIVFSLYYQAGMLTFLLQFTFLSFRISHAAEVGKITSARFLYKTCHTWRW